MMRKKTSVQDVINFFISTTKPPSEVITFLKDVSRGLGESNDPDKFMSILFRVGRDFAGQNPSQQTRMAIDLTISVITDLVDMNKTAA